MLIVGLEVRLELDEILLGEAAGVRKEQRPFSHGDDLLLDAELLVELARLHLAGENADGPRDGGRRSKDRRASNAGDEVATRRGHISHRDDDGLGLLRLGERAPHEIARERAATRRVHSEHDRPDPRVFGDRFDDLDESSGAGRTRALAAGDAGSALDRAAHLDERHHRGPPSLHEMRGEPEVGAEPERPPLR